MLKRRAKIKVKPVISAASNTSIAPEVENLPTNTNETPTGNENNSADRTENRGDDQQRIENIPILDQILEFKTELNQSLFESVSQIGNTESIVDTFNQASPEPLPNNTNHENAPNFEECIGIPIVFSNENDQDVSSIPEILESTRHQVFNEEPTTLSNKQNDSRLDRKRAADERLVDKMVKKRVMEKQRSRISGILSQPINPSRMCMRDLIHLNPIDNPMTQSEVNEGRTILKEASISKPQEEKDDDDDLPVPQLVIGPDGKIIINEASLVIEQKEPNFDDMMIVDDTNFLFDGYKAKKPRSKKWGIKETKRFYAALSMIGTDFSLISKLIPSRTRDEIKNKFKSEDKKNRALIDTALKVKKPLDISLLAEPMSDDDLEDDKPPPKKKKADAQKQNTPKIKKQRATKISEKENNNNKKINNNNNNKNNNNNSKSPKNTGVSPSDSTKEAEVLLNSSDESSQEASTIEVVKSTRITTRKEKSPKKRKVIEDDDSSNGDVVTRRNIIADDDSSNNDVAMRRKIIEDDDSTSSESATRRQAIEESTTTNEENALEKSVNPYEFNEDTDVENEVEITKYTKKRQSKTSRPSKPSQSSSTLGGSSSLGQKFSQQLEQMSVDQRKSELKTINENVDSDVYPTNPPEEDDSRENRKLFDLLPSSGKSKSSISVIDHNSINLQELGIEKIPPNHKLVVVSTQLKNSLSHDVDDPDQQLLQVFTISESALESMMEEADDSTFDPVAMLLSMAQGIHLDDDAQEQNCSLENFCGVSCGDDDLNSSDNDANLLDGVISNDVMMSPPLVQDERFEEDIKYPAINHCGASSNRKAGVVD